MAQIQDLRGLLKVLGKPEIFFMLEGIDETMQEAQEASASLPADLIDSIDSFLKEEHTFVGYVELAREIGNPAITKIIERYLSTLAKLKKAEGYKELPKEIKDNVSILADGKAKGSYRFFTQIMRELMNACKNYLKPTQN